MPEAGGEVIHNFDISPLCVENLTGDQFPDSEFKVKLYDGRQKLLIFERCVVWISGGILVRKINLESRIVDCHFTLFDGQKQDSPSTEGGQDAKVLVVILEDQIRVYNRLRSVSVVSFPIHIQSAFPFPRGLIIGKKVDAINPFNPLNRTPFPGDSTASYSAYSNPMATSFSANTSYNSMFGYSSTGSNLNTENNFLTLTDPIGELGAVVSSSTTSFSPLEEMVLYPHSTNSSLAATFNLSENLLHIYYTRYLSRGKSSKSKSYSTGHQSGRKSGKRVTSLNGTIAGTLNTRFFDDDLRTLRSTSNPMSFDRMASGTEYSQDGVGNTTGLHPFLSIDGCNVRKDVIFTRITSISFPFDITYLKIQSLSYKDKEAITIINLKTHSIDIYIFDKSPNQASLSKYKNKLSLRGLDATIFDMGKLKSSYLLILKNEHELVLYNPFYELFSPLLISPASYPVLRIDDVKDCEISLLCADGKHYSLFVQTKPKDVYVNNLITSLKYLSHDLIYENFWLHWCSNISLNIPYCDDWKLYTITLLSLGLPDKIDISHIDPSTNEITQLLPYVLLARRRNQTSSKENSSISSDLTLESLLPKIVLSLHIVREDLKLNILAQKQHDRLTVLLSQLICWMSWSDSWQLYYTFENILLDRTIKFTMAEYIAQPPSIMDSLGSLFSNQLITYITFSIIAGEDESIDKIITPRTYNILRLFEVIVSAEFENLDLIRTMVSFNVDASDVETYPPGIYFVFKNTIELCQQKLKLNWNVTREELKLIGRNDLLYLDSEKTKINMINRGDRSLFSNGFDKVTPKSIKEIITQLDDNEVLNAWDGQAEADKFHVTRLIFSKDRRFYELTKLLQTSKIQTITDEADSEMNEYEKLLYHRSICAKIALRTLTTPIGRGAVFNSSRKPLVTEGFPIPKMNFNTLVLPHNISVTLEKDTISNYLMEWGYFHNGVSAGLSVLKEFDGISGSWVAFNRPPVLNAQHAGFLLGLGLNGHLKQLEEWHIYNYLGPKHTYTSIGLLLGMAASLKGTMDIKVTKVLSVHVVAFLPPGSTNLNVQLSVQTAGLIGIGLLYLETQHRRMSDILLAQISSSLIISDKKVVSEGYQLAAGFALGYINLSKGNEMLSTTDNHIINDLISYGTSIRDVETLTVLDKSSSGAVMALMLMFLKTNNTEIAEKLSLPKTVQLLDYVRPDLLMLRSFGRNIILWNSIEPLKSFVEEQIPSCISIKYSIETIENLESNILPFINILAGVLLSISVCFASTANADAKKTLLYYFDKLLNLSSIEPTNYDSKISLIGIRNARDVMILGLSIVMAGTGDLDVMRRLRYLQGITDDNTRYGNYMAINMALGFLFLGGGQQAFNTNDNFAVAALITSIYPMFGANNYENIDESEIGGSNKPSHLDELHLQALRHFWALSVENRCLVVREIETEKPVKADVDVVLKNKAILKVPSPCLLPNLDLINKISVTRNNIYFPVEFDMVRSTTSSANKFKKNLILYVDKKASYKTLKLNFNEMVDIDEEMSNLRINDNGKEQGVSCLKQLEIFNGLERFEKNILFDTINSDSNKYITSSTVFDFRHELEKVVSDVNLIDEDKLANLKLIFSFVDSIILLNDDDYNNKRKRRKTRKFLKGSNTNLDNYFNFDETDNAFIENNDITTGLNYLNIEFVEKLKKELFSKFG